MIGELGLSEGNDSLDFIPRKTSWDAVFNPFEYRRQELQNMADWANAEYDTEAKERAERVYGGHSSGLDFSVGEKLARLTGVYDAPELWFAGQKKPIPHAEYRVDMYEAIAQDFRKMAKKNWEENKERKRKYDAQKDEFEALANSYVAGEGFITDAWLRNNALKNFSLLFPKGLDDEKIATLNRARDAVEWMRDAEKEGFSQRFRPTALEGILKTKNGEIDGHAYDLAMNTARELIKREKGTDEIIMWERFIDGLESGISDLLNTAESVLTEEPVLTDILLGSPVAGLTDKLTIAKPSGEKPADPKRLARLQALARMTRDWRDARAKTAKGSPWYNYLSNDGAGMLGSNAPLIPLMFTSGVGGAVAVGAVSGAQAMGDDYTRRLSELDYATLGSKEARMRAMRDASVTGVGQGIAETAFGFTGLGSRGVKAVFGRLSRAPGLIGKTASATTSFAGKIGAKVDNLAEKTAVAVARTRPGSFILGNTWARALPRPFSVAVDELVFENLIQSPAEVVAAGIYEKCGYAVDERHIKILQDITEGVTDAEMLGGTLGFGLAVVTGQLLQIRNACKGYRENYKQHIALGIREDHAREIVAMADPYKANGLAKKYMFQDTLADPVTARERAKKAQTELMSENEAEANRVTGAVGALMKAQGIGDVRELTGEENMWEITHTKEDGTEEKTRLSTEQLDAWIQVGFQEQNRAALQHVQAAILGSQLAKDADTKLDYVSTLDMSQIGEEIRADIEKHGGVTLNTMGLLSKRAAAAIDALTGNGMTQEEAEASTDDDILPGVSLGVVASMHRAARERLKISLRDGEKTRGEVKSIMRGAAPLSNAFRLKTAADIRNSLLLYSDGNATAAEIGEDVHESALAAYMADHQYNINQLWEELRKADKALGGILGTYDGPLKNGLDAVEAFSRLSLSHSLANIEHMDVPQAIKTIATYAKGSLETTTELLKIGQAWNEFTSTEEGRAYLANNGTLATLLADTGNVTESLLSGMTFEASSADAVAAAMEQAGLARAAKDAAAAPQDIDAALAQAAGETSPKTGDDKTTEPPAVQKLKKQAEELADKLAHAKNAGEAAELKNELDNAQALIAAEQGAPYVTPAYDWTARDEEGLADTAAMEKNMTSTGPGISLSLAGESPLHIHENGIQYTRNGSFYTAAATDVAAPGMAVEGGVPETEGRGVEARPDGRADAGAGSGVRQGHFDRSVGLPLEKLRGPEVGLRADGVRLLTRRLHRIGSGLKDKPVLQKIYTGDLCELAPGAESALVFQEAIEAARRSHGLKGECVYVYPAEEYEHMRLFLTPDGMAGMALKEDGDMVSIFSHKERGKKGDGNAAYALVALAINEGAVKADCYGEYLVRLYGKFGFRAVAKDQFNVEFASEAMQNEDAMRANFRDEDGRPDVVYLVYEGDRSRVLDEYDPTYTPTYQTDLEYTDYDACLERQNKEVEKQRRKESPEISLSLSGVSRLVADVRDEEGLADTAAREKNMTSTGPGISLSLAGESPLHIHENGIQYTRNGSFYTAAATDVAAPGMAVEGGVPETEGRGVEAWPDGRTNAGAGSGVQQGSFDRSAGSRLEDLRRAESGGRADGIRLLTRRLHRVNTRGKKSSHIEDFYTGDLCELVPGKESAIAFTKAIETARQSRGLKGECVYVYPAEEYEHMRLFLTPDGMAGMALKEDGDMVSVFSHKERAKKGDGNAAYALVALAINEGAVKADCYGRFLTGLYGRFGFRAVAKDQFSPEFASEAMQNEDAMRANFRDEDGRPDVVYLVYEGDRSRVLDEYDPTYTPTYQTELEYTDYDACLKRQNEEVEKQRRKESPEISLSLSGVSRLVADVRDEVRAIRQQAKKSGNYLKAPNGKESNLPSGLWELVRTVGFKRWFGDWMNGPETASKVVDENEEPKILWLSHKDGSLTASETRTEDASPVFANIRRPGQIENGIYHVTEPGQLKSATDTLNVLSADTPGITFSLIGEHAATWDKHRERAFMGRADGKARAELDASQAALLEDGVRAARKEAVPLGRFVGFPELFEAYPQLAALPVRFSDSLERDVAGSLSMSPNSGEKAILLNAALKPEAVLPALLHEVQHAIQGIEGFAPGGTLLDAYAVYTGRLGGMIDRFNNGNKSGEVPRLSGDVTQAAAELNGLLAALADRKGEEAAALRAEAAAAGARLMEIYRNMPGEVEARRVAERLRMKAAERARVSFSVAALGPDGKVLTPATFVTKPDGNPDWFVLPARKGQAAMPVRLLVGEDTEPHRGYGLTHIAASRNEEGLWATMSPDKYLANILAEVSELWEIVPGREILVRGKRPSSWMVLQLDKGEGYYSIVTAYPTRPGQKPKGKKLPLVERTIGQNSQKDTRQTHLSTNPDAEPGAFGALKNKAASSGSFAGEEDALSIPQGARVVNINDVQLRFDDGGMMPASFSISSTLREDIAEAYENKTRNDAVIPLCTCPPVFRALDLPEADIVTQAHIVRKLRGKHGLTVEQIVEAVGRLDDPLFIVRESQKTIILFPGGQAINRLGEPGDMIAPIKLERTRDGKHFMASLFPLDELTKISSYLRKGGLLYSKYSKEALESTRNAPELSSDLMRLVVNQGFTEHTITSADVVKPQGAQPETGGLSLSLAEPQTAYGGLLENIYNARVSRLKKSLDLQLKRWNLLTTRWRTAGEKIVESEALEAYGRVISTVGEINRALPEKYREKTVPALTKAWKLAQAIKKGEATVASIARDPAKYHRLLDKGDKTAVNKQARLDAAREAEEGIDSLVRELLETALANIESQRKNIAVGRVMKALERVAVKKRKDGKLARGKMNAEAYKTVQGYIAKMRASGDNKAAAMEELEAKMAGTTKQEELDRIAGEIKEWSLYGNLDGMTAQQAATAAEALKLFIAEEREQWKTLLEERRREATKDARAVAEHIGEADPQQIKDARERAQRGREQVKWGFVHSCLNFAHLLLRSS